MKSRYDYMRPSIVEDIDGQQYPDPLSINYQIAIDKYETIPSAHNFTNMDLKKMWVTYFQATGKLEMDDVLFSINGIEHVGVLEPGDSLYLYDPELVEQFRFKNLENPPKVEQVF